MMKEHTMLEIDKLKNEKENSFFQYGLQTSINFSILLGLIALIAIVYEPIHKLTLAVCFIVMIVYHFFTIKNEERKVNGINDKINQLFNKLLK